MTTPAQPEQAPLTVLYDGACPLCRREIGLYRGLRADAPVCFADVSDTASPLPPGTTRDQLMARFHVQRADGQLVSGARPSWRSGRCCPAGAGWPGRPPARHGLADGMQLPPVPARPAGPAALGRTPGPSGRAGQPVRLTRIATFQDPDT